MTPSAQLLSMLRERNTQILLSPNVSIKNFGSSLLHLAANTPDILQLHLNTLTPTEQYNMANLLKLNILLMELRTLVFCLQ
jgi:hypothetical protein